MKSVNPEDIGTQSRTYRIYILCIGGLSYALSISLLISLSPSPPPPTQSINSNTQTAAANLMYIKLPMYCTCVFYTVRGLDFDEANPLLGRLEGVGGL
jgi:hypothetical protein